MLTQPHPLRPLSVFGCLLIRTLCFQTKMERGPGGEAELIATNVPKLFTLEILMFLLKSKIVNPCS